MAAVRRKRPTLRDRLVTAEADRNHWKAFARRMEERMIEARERAHAAERALKLLQRAIDLLEKPTA